MMAGLVVSFVLLWQWGGGSIFGFAPLVVGVGVAPILGRNKVRNAEDFMRVFGLTFAVAFLGNLLLNGLIGLVAGLF